MLSGFMLASCCGTPDQDLVLNESEYFERQGVNVLVYSNLYNGGFNAGLTALVLLPILDFYKVKTKFEDDK